MLLAMSEEFWTSVANHLIQSATTVGLAAVPAFFAWLNIKRRQDTQVEKLDSQDKKLDAAKDKLDDQGEKLDANTAVTTQAAEAATVAAKRAEEAHGDINVIKKAMNGGLHVDTLTEAARSVEETAKSMEETAKVTRQAAQETKETAKETDAYVHKSIHRINGVLETLVVHVNLISAKLGLPFVKGPDEPQKLVEESKA